MSKKLVWLLIIVSITALVLIGNGCKTESPDVSGEISGETNVETEATEETAKEEKEETSDEQVTITFWHNNNEAYQETYTSLAESFMAANPGINVKIVLQPTVGYDQKIMAAFVAGNEPEIIDSAHDFALEIEQKYGAWANLDDYNVRGWEEVQLMDPNILDSLSFSGKLYGLQATDQVLALFIRKSWMENVGWEKDYPYIESWDDLIELGKKFTFEDPDKNGQNDTWGYEMFGSLDRNYATVQFEYIMNAAGEELVTKEGELNINTDIGIKALSFMQDAVWTHKISPTDTATYTHVEFYRDIPAGVVGIGRLGSWNVGGWLEALNNDFVAAPYPPVNAGDEYYASTIYHAIMMSINCKHPEETLKFMQFLCGKEAQEELYVNHGMSYRPDLDYGNLCATEQDLFFKDSMLPEKVNRIYLITAPWWTADARATLAEYIQSALIDPNLDPAEILARAEEEIIANYMPK